MCALPKGFIKNIKIVKPKTGVAKREELIDDFSKGGTFLPRGVMYEDMDKSFIDFVDKDLTLSVDGEKVPVIFLTLQRWSEFSKTWQHSDKYKNIKMPFITVVRQPNPQVGNNQSGLYNIPGRTGINVSPETVLALAEHSNIIGIKEASCIIEQCIEIAFHKPNDFLLISGDDVQAVPIISIGGVGVMSVIANALPNKFSEMIHHALKGDFVSAQKILGHFLAIDSYLYEEGNPVGVKLILEHLGLMESQVRRPLASGSNELKINLVNRCKQEKLI